MIPLCKEERIALIPWSPLTRGFLTGKYKRGEDPKTSRYEGDKYLAERYFRTEDFDVVDAVVAVAKEKNVSPAQVALAWLLQKGVTAPIIGATKIEHIDEAVEALNVRLTAEELTRLEAGYKPHPVLGHE